MTLPVVFTANGPSGYNLTKSLRFRSSASAYLNRTPASAGNRQTWTYSFWAKRGALGATQFLFDATTGATGTRLYFTSSDVLQFDTGGTGVFTTTQVFRDPSAWYHIVFVADTTQATASNRIKLYINGVQVTSFSSASYPAQNTSMDWNNTVFHYLGRNGNASVSYLDGYLTEINNIDGQALTPSSFGSTNSLTGVWQPAKYTGTYGTNGFYLPFTNTTSTSTLGNDFSGNSNNWTTNNISLTAGSTYDSMTDVPTLTSATTANYCVLNPLDNGGLPVSGGNLNLSSTTAQWYTIRASMALPSTGKYYWEYQVFDTGYNSIGILDTTGAITANTYIYNQTYGYAWQSVSAIKGNNGTTSSYGTAASANDVFMIAFDADNRSLFLGKNGTWFNSSNPATNTSPMYSSIPTTSTFFPAFAQYATANSSTNFGQQGFAYTPPTGFVALNTFNLPTPTVGSTSSTLASKNFDINLYTGTGATQSITNAQSFQPSMIWFKSRSNATNNVVHDVLRGTAGINRLFTDTTAAQSTTGDGFLSINSNGFTLDSTGTGGDVNTNTRTYVAWQWAGPSSGTTNTNGTRTSTVAANTTAGFSVVTYTGNGSSGATVGHGLGVKPAIIITKSMGTVESWEVWNSALNNGSYGLQLRLNSSNGSFSASDYNGTPTSTTFTLGGFTGTNGNGTNYVSYCWAEIAGFSSFGIYTGNGSTDGTFVYTGFRPKYVIVKRTDTGGDWRTQDGVRNPYNAANSALWANITNAETSVSGYNLDLVSNGFKLKNSNADSNASGGTYIYMAFAENPFKYSLAR